MRTALTLMILLVALALAAPAGAAQPRFNSSGAAAGIADNTLQMFGDKRFERARIKRVRVTVPFDDLARPGNRRRYQDAWFALAQRAGVEPLVSFNRSYRGKHRLPTVAQFRKGFRRFRARYPWVKHFSTWSEANFPNAQPTGNRPALTAAFYRTLRRGCAGGRCTVLTADIRVDGSAHTRWWLREFKRRMGRGPHTWGLVPYLDINRFSTRHTREFLRLVRGKVWATEAGAINFFGRGIRPSITRQTRAMRFLMSTWPRVSKRIKRIYVYHWRAARGNRLWDSALLSISGKRRPAYRIFFRGIGRRAP